MLLSQCHSHTTIASYVIIQMSRDKLILVLELGLAKPVWKEITYPQRHGTGSLLP